MMRGKLITGLESQRDRPGAITVSPALMRSALKKLLDAALHVFDNLR
jgi:hypothetical protein